MKEKIKCICQYASKKAGITKKQARGLLILFVVSVSGCLVSIVFNIFSPSSDITSITRNQTGQGNKEIEITARQDEYEVQMPFEIGETRYSDEAINELAEKMEVYLLENIFARGDSVNQVTDNLTLFKEVSGYPFSIEWESSDYSILDVSGFIDFQNIEEGGAVVTLTATLTYYDFLRSYSFPICIYPKQRSGLAVFEENVDSLLKKSDGLHLEEEHIILPEELDGRPIYWSVKRENTFGKVCLYLMLLSVILFILLQKRYENQKKARTLQLTRDYPLVVNKLTLYLGAGLSLRTAFLKTAFNQYSDKKAAEHPVYQEMRKLCHEMENGLSEGAAYEKFGSISDGDEYRKLAILLNQNLMKGSNYLAGTLREKTREAFDKRKNNAKKMGEEAGTKLLGPMMLILVVVMIMIMFPAFFSFG